MKFINPYDGLPESEAHKTTINTSGQDLAFLNSVHQRRGTLQTGLGILIKKLITYLKDNGCTSYDPDRFEQLIADVQLSVGQPEAARPERPNPPAKTPPRNVDRGAKPVARSSPRTH